MERVKAEWLNLPNPEYGGKSPSCLIEYERVRLPWVSSEEDSPFQEDCPYCHALADERFGPGFWHLDGCNMDKDFAFSFYRTYEEWEREERCFKEIAQSVNQDEDKVGAENIH